MGVSEPVARYLEYLRGRLSRASKIALSDILDSLNSSELKFDDEILRKFKTKSEDTGMETFLVNRSLTFRNLSIHNGRLQFEP